MNPETSAPMIRYNDVRKSFGETVAVDGVSFEVGRGEVFGLLGPNGAGKTTLVNMTVGLLQPDAGTIDIDGHGDGSQPQVRAKIGVAPQALSLYEVMSGVENLTFFGQIQGLSGKMLRDRVAAVLDIVNLSDRGKSRVSEYSGGMKRRLNLAVALIHDPPLLLLDEPTVGVDPQSRNAIFDNIEALRDEGRTVVYTTHYMEEAQRLCDRVAIMDNGKLLAIDTVERLVRQHGGRSVVVAEGDGGEVRIETEDPMGELVALQAQGALLRFAVESPSLEGVFLNLTGRHLRD